VVGSGVLDGVDATVAVCDAVGLSVMVGVAVGVSVGGASVAVSVCEGKGVIEAVGVTVGALAMLQAVVMTASPTQKILKLIVFPIVVSMHFRGDLSGRP
jgi:hypothetical protein